MKQRKQAGTKLDVAQAVTDKILAKLEQGTVPWQKPWSAAAGGVPVSMSTGRPYRGINTILLALAAQESGWASPWFGTFNQIRDLGGNVKGQKSTLVVFWKRLPIEETVDGKKVRKIIPLLKYFRVFNADQAEGLPEKYYAPAESEGTFAEHKDAERVLKEYLSRDDAPEVRYGGDRAYYADALNRIQLPRREDFFSEEEFYSTAFHEVTHSTGSPRRLDRKGIAEFDHFGSEKYGREELVAEMGSAILQAVTGIESPFDNSVAYLNNWLKAIKGDKKLIITAAGQAQRAVDHILGLEYAGDSDTEAATAQ